MNNEQLKQIEKLVNCVDRYGSDSFYEGTQETRTLLREAVATGLNQEVPDDYESTEYAQIDQIANSLTAISFFRNSLQASYSKPFIDAQETAHNGAVQLATVLSDQIDTSLIEIVQQLSGKLYTDLSTNEHQLYHRIGLAMIFANLLDG